MASITSTLTLTSENPKKHPLDAPNYALEDLPDPKANRILYPEFGNRTATVLHQPDIKALIRRSRKRIEWAEVGGGGRCEQKFIDDIEARVGFLEGCLAAREALQKGAYESDVLKEKYDDLVKLERTIGGFWARPRKAGEWQYVKENIQKALESKPETLNALEEFLLVNDLLYAIISSTALSNLLLFGGKFPSERTDISKIGLWANALAPWILTNISKSCPMTATRTGT
jgi:hypothetical protein